MTIDINHHMHPMHVMGRAIAAHLRDVFGSKLTSKYIPQYAGKRDRPDLDGMVRVKCNTFTTHKVVAYIDLAGNMVRCIGKSIDTPCGRRFTGAEKTIMLEEPEALAQVAAFIRDALLERERINETLRLASDDRRRAYNVRMFGRP